MNHVVLMGNLARDPEVRYVNAGGDKVAVASFTLAVSRYFTKKDGSKEQDTVFIPCEAWSSSAETVGKYLVKGSKLLLEGSLKMDTWEKDGQKHSRLKVRTLRFEMLGGKRKEEEAQPEESNNTPQVDEDDLPVDAAGADIPF